MKLKAFTMLEILIVIVILGILAGVSIVSYGNMVIKANNSICEENQLAIKEALRYYIYEHDAVPASLSELYPVYTDMALARLNSRMPFRFKLKRKLCFALKEIGQPSHALAAPPAFSTYLGAGETILKCPDKTGSGRSYAYNGSITNAASFKHLVTNDLPVVCDSNQDTFSANGAGNVANADMAKRHKSRIGGPTIAIAVGGKRTRAWITPSKNWTHPVFARGNDQSDDDDDD